MSMLNSIVRSTSSNQDMFRSPGDQEDQALLLPPKPKENVGNERCTGPWCEFPGSFLDMSRHAIPDGPHVSTQSRMNEKAEMPVLSSGHSGLAWAKFCPDPPPPWCSLLQSMLNSTLTDSSDDHHDLLQGRVEADSQVVQFCGNPPPPWCEGLFSIANSTLHSFSKDQNDAVRERAKGDQQSPPILAEEKESPGIVLTRQFCEGPSPPPWCEFVSALLNDDKPDPSNNQQVLEQGHSHLHASDEGTAKESTNSSKGSDPPAWYTVPLAIRISPSDGSSQICGAWGCKPSYVLSN